MFKKKHRNGIGCIYRIQSEAVEFPEGFIGGPDVGLLLDRETIVRTVPGTAIALSRNLVATTFPDRGVRLYSERRWWELRNFLEKLPNGAREVRFLKRVVLGFEVTLKPSNPLVIPASLQLMARLTGDDVLIVFEDDYMEIWADGMLGTVGTAQARG